MRKIATALVFSCATAVSADTAHFADPHDPFGELNTEFELLDYEGTLVNIEDYRGKFVLLAFGFTHCAHICPMIAAKMGFALKATDRDAIGIFISIDTERDNPATTHTYATAFADRMIGLGGSYEQVSAAANNFKVSFAVTKTQSNYTVQHTPNIYLLNPDGSLNDVFALNTQADTIAAAMK